MFDKSCDTMVALPSATAHGQTIFAKNSDRPADECQPLELHTRIDTPTDSETHCQFVTLPEADVIYRHVGSRPWWCWGYEHGFNEHQVVIGNEGLGSKFESWTESKLIGMEVLRLGLERGKTAREAVGVMTGVITEYGQGKFDNDAGVRTYDNGYIVADPNEAYVIETAGHQWVVKRVEDALGISNVYSVETDYEEVSPDAEAIARENGWWQGDEKFNFADAFSKADRMEGSGASRRKRSCALLSARSGNIDPRSMMATLSDHSDAVRPDEEFQTDLRQGGICVHFNEDGTGGNTAASLVADLCNDGSRLPVYWCSFLRAWASSCPSSSRARCPARWPLGARSRASRAPGGNSTVSPILYGKTRKTALASYAISGRCNSEPASAARMPLPKKANDCSTTAAPTTPRICSRPLWRTASARCSKRQTN